MWSGIVTKDVSEIGTLVTARRYLAIWFPFIATDRLHRHYIKDGAGRDDKPLVVVEKIKGALRIAAIDHSAARLGLTPGLTLADARARIPDLYVAQADTKSDALLIEQIAEHCHRFTPSVALDLPDGLILDITGCAHLFGGEAHMQTKILDTIRSSGFALRGSIAGTPDTARALARYSSINIAPQGKDEFCVKRLPVMALAGVERETIIALSRAGLKTVGDLSRRPPEVLAARFGQALVTCLMRTIGREDARITPLRPVPSIIVGRQFAEPFTQADAIEGILASLIADAHRALQERDEGGRVFEASFFRSDGAVRRIVVQTGRPSRDAESILRLYRERLDTLSDPIDPGFGFDCVRLAVPITETLSAEQPKLDPATLNAGASENDAVGDLVDRLVVRFGRDRVQRFAPRDTHDPDCGARLVSAEHIETQKTLATAKRARSSPDGWPPLEPGEPPLRPLQLFARPQPIEALAEVPDGPPLRFRWRRMLHNVVRSEGPERIEAEWWRKGSRAEARDYYRVEDVGGCRFWIFRQGHYGQGEARPRWFLHGVFA